VFPSTGKGRVGDTWRSVDQLLSTERGTRRLLR
jgi:hypothetical protein